MATTVQRRMIFKGSLWIFLTLIILLFTAGCSSEPKNTPEEAIDLMEEAIKKNNVNAFLNIATSMDKMYELSQEDAQALIDYFKDNKDELERELERLDVMSNGNNPKNDWMYESSLLYLTYSEDKWGSGGQYKIGIQPSYFTLYTNFKDTSIYINDEIQTIAKYNDYSKVVGPLAPGEYKLRAEYKTEDSTYSSDEQVIILPASGRETVNLRVAAEKIKFSSNYEDADLYLNGTFTGMTIAEANEKAQLLATDGSVTAQAKIMQNDILLESDAVSIIGYDNLYYLELPAEYVYLSTAISGGQLYMNDKPTGFILNNYENNEFGPLAAGITVMLHAEFDSPWGRLSTYTEEIYVHGDELSNSYLSYNKLNDNVDQSIGKSLAHFMQSGFTALNNDNSDLLQNTNVDSRYRVLDVLSYSIYSTESTLLDMTINLDYAELSGSVDESTIEAMSMNYIYVDVNYTYPEFVYSYYWSGDYNDDEWIDIESSASFIISMDYNINNSEWEISHIENDYSWWNEGNQNDFNYYDFR